MFFVEPIERRGAGGGAVYWVLVDMDSGLYSIFRSSEDLFDDIGALSGVAMSPRLSRLGMSIIGHAVDRGLKIVSDRPRRGELRATISKAGDWRQIDINFRTGGRLVFVESNEFYDISIEDCVHFDDGIELIAYLSTYFEAPLLFDRRPMESAINKLRDMVDPLIRYGCLKSPTAVVMDMIRSDIGNNKYRYFFPEPQDPAYLRKFYAGGVFYVNRKYQSKDLQSVYRYDYNRMYGSIMATKRLPVGNPVEISWEEYMGGRRSGRYLYLLDCSFAFHVKQGRMPCIRSRNNYFWRMSDLLEDSEGEPMHMYLTSLDFEAIEERYDITEFTCYRVLRFAASDRTIAPTIRALLSQIETSERDGDKLGRKVLKGMVVRAYGGFGRGEISETFVPYLDKGVTMLRRSEIDRIPSNYTPLAIFVSAYSRCAMYDSMELVGNDLVYVAVDSLHCLRDMSDVLDIDPFRTGALKLECVEDRARYIGVNTYCFESGRKFDYVVAGVRVEGWTQVCFDNFKPGFVILGGVQYKPEPYGYSKKPVMFSLLAN